MTLATAVLYGSARRARQGIKAARFVVRFLDEYEWYARALKIAREGERVDDELPVQQALCRES